MPGMKTQRSAHLAATFSLTTDNRSHASQVDIAVFYKSIACSIFFTNLSVNLAAGIPSTTS
jgi:hypothetical protein